MEMQDIKLLGMNAGSLMLSFSNIDTGLKIILLVLSIGYTLQKWYLMNKNDKK
jgi:hypothetical protein|tara:strand:+ start:228 stop:386 length:159 start_codon:yes stop_codon:yes gene_type:complete